MVFAVAGGGQLDTTGSYQIDNSLRFNDSDSAFLNRTFGSGGNRQTFTWSGWVKESKLGSIQVLFSSISEGQIRFQSDGSILILHQNERQLTTNGLFRDPSAWYHIVVAFDSTQATSSNRIKLYVNGVQITSFTTTQYPDLNANLPFNANEVHNLGKRASTTTFYYGGYMTEVHFVNGQQLSPTDFGEFDEDSGIWKPIEYTGTYGTNGFYLDFENSGSLGADQSGNGNNFTPTNLTSTDQMIDTPTNNFATLNANDVSGGALSQGNLLQTSSGASNTNGTIGMPTGKWYWEIYINSGSGGVLGIGTGSAEVGTALADLENIYGYSPNGNKYENTSASSYGASYGTGDIIGIKFDADTRQLEFLKNNSSQGVAFTVDSGDTYLPQIHSNGTNFTMNFGQDSSFAGATTKQNNTDANNLGDFYYSVPSGYLALCTQNLATELEPTIDDGSEYFQTALYSGTNSSNAITNNGNSDLQPDWLWIKERSSTSGHILIDSSRGITKSLESHDTAAEGTSSTKLLSINSDGFTVGNDNGTNESGQTYVAWQWKANAGSTSSNTDGSITSTVQTSGGGFSIVTYTGNGTAGATFGHGLGAVPDLIIVKRRDSGSMWNVWTPALTNNQALYLNRTSAIQSSTTFWQDTTPTSSVITLGTDRNVNGGTYVCYAFKNIEGYSKIGTYTGNGSSDGIFVYLGFRPAFIITKRTNTDEHWAVWDSTRDTFNVAEKRLAPNDSVAEATSSTTLVDFLSNGFKPRTSGVRINGNGQSYIYIAFAENPFVTSGAVPVTAR